MTTHEVQSVLRREGQLNAIAYTIIIVLLAMVVTLLIPYVSDFEFVELEVLSSHIARTLFVGLLLMFILYLVDQHRKLRSELLTTHERLEIANEEMASAYQRLSFAQHTASVMASLAEPDALDRVLRDAASHFRAEAAAVVGEDITLFAEEGTDSTDAESAVLHVALDVVRAGKAMATGEGAQGGQAIAVPLRIQGELKSVVCLWRKGDPFASDQLEGLILMARIIELSLENRMLLRGVSDQLQGTLSVLSALLDRRIPGNAHHSNRMAENAVAVGRVIGLGQRELSDLRIAALMADVGMIFLPEHVGADSPTPGTANEAALRSHPVAGAKLAARAKLSERVQDAIHDHHERLDGSGYPRGRKGGAIPVEARILAVCDVYDSLTSPSSGRPTHTPTQAASLLMLGAGTHYDAEVVRAFLQVISVDAPTGFINHKASSELKQVAV